MHAVREQRVYRLLGRRPALARRVLAALPAAAARGGARQRARPPRAQPDRFRAQRPAAEDRDRPRRARGRAALALPARLEALPGRPAAARRGQLRRVGLRPAPQPLDLRRPRPDAVHAGDLGGLRPRRRHRRPARRDPRRGELPARQRRPARRDPRAVPLQPVRRTTCARSPPTPAGSAPTGGASTATTPGRCT